MITNYAVTMTTYVSQPLGLEYYNETHGSHDNIFLNCQMYMSQT